MDVVSAVTEFRSGDVLFSKLRPYLEKYALAEFDGKCTGEILAFAPERIRGSFLRWAVASPEFIGRCNMLAYGAKMPRVNWPNQLAQFVLPLPPAVEQDRVAAYLAATCVALDRAVDRKREQVRVLNLAWRAELQRAVTRGLSDRPVLRPTGDPWLAEVPASWGLRALKRASTTQGGLTLGKTYDGPVIERPYLRVANVQDGFLDLEDVTTIELPASAAARVELRRNDVLMNEGGDLDKLGRGCLWNDEIPGCLHQNHVFAVRCFPHLLDPVFLTHVTASAYGRAYFEATGKRTTNLAATNSTKVGLFPVPTPPLPEQQRIAAFLNERTSEFARLRGNLQRQVETLTAYRRSLIHECVTGIRRVTQEDLNRVLHHAVLPS